MAAAYHPFWRGVAALLTTSVIAFISSLAAGTKAKHAGDAINFEAPGSLRIFAFALPTIFLLAFVGVLIWRPFELGSLTLLIVGLLGFFGIPSTLSVTPHGLRQKYWWWKEEIILWKHVKEINFNTAAGAVRVQDDQGRVITHSRMHRDRAEFVRLCRTYARSVAVKMR